MLRIGMLLADRYEILQQIGSGGMAYVYRAKDHKLNRYVAIKVLKEEFCKDKAFVSKFRMEAQAAAGLSHANIVGVYDVGEINNSIYFIVMELIEGITLKEYIIRKRRLGVKESIGVAIQVAQGLAAAHSRHLIHRDIKPQNIIISRDGKIKVADFGIARGITDETTNMYKAAGSVHYISPEQARGGYCDERSDIYSLGITMYEMVTGRVPFDGDTTVAVAIAHMNEAIVPPSQYEPSVPLALEQIIFKCVQKRPERRYASCEELIADLRQAIVTPQKGFVKFAPVDDDPQQVQEGTYQGGSAAPVSQDTIQISPIPQRSRQTYQQNNSDRDGIDFSNPSSRGQSAKKTAVQKNTASSRSQQGSAGQSKDRYHQAAAGRQQARKEKPRQPQREERRQEYVRQPQNRRTETVEAGGTVFDKVLLGIGTAFGILILLMVIYIAVTLNGLFSAGSAGKKGRMLDSQAASTEQMTEAKITEMETETESEEEEGSTEEDKDAVKVPGLCGKSLAEAKTLMTKAGLQMRVSSKYEYSDLYAAGTICNQDKEEGSSVKKGSQVTVTISIGSDKFHLIGSNYIHQNLSVLQYALNSYKEIDVVLVGQESEEYKKNTVLNLDPMDGDLAPGDTLTVYYSTGPSTVTVPELWGKSKEQAVSALEAIGLHLGAVSEQYNDSVDAGVICGQSAASGSTVRIDSSIDVVISLGRKTCVVPDLMRNPEADAISQLAAINLTYDIVRENSNEYPAGVVFRQSIAAGTTVVEWTNVTLTVSLGPQEIAIDTNVAGKTPEEVQNTLAAQGVACNIAYENSDSIAAGLVIRIDLPGAVYSGSTVQLVVSAGPAETPAQPDPVPDTEPAVPETENILAPTAETAALTADELETDA